MGLFRKAIKDEFVIVVISSGLTMNVVKNAVMVSTIRLSKPSYWQLMNPDGYAAFFRARQSGGRRRAELLVAQVQDLILQDDRFAEFKVGVSEGELVTEVNWMGRICIPPMGGAVNDAFRNQKSKKELQNNGVVRTR